MVARKAADNSGMIALVGVLGLLALNQAGRQIPDAARSAAEAGKRAAGNVADAIIGAPDALIDKAKRGIADSFNDRVRNPLDFSREKEFLGGLFFGGDDEEEYQQNLYIHPETGIPVPTARPRPGVITEDFFGEYE